MEKNWRDYPQKINNWNDKINYVMFIDENGNSGNVQDFYKKITNNLPISEDDKFFTITGVIFEKQQYSIMRNNIRKLKEKYWENGYYYDSKRNDTRYVCFHSRDIRRHDGAFNDSLIDYKSFMTDLSSVLQNIDCKIISISINLEEYVKQGYIDNVYCKAFDLLFERYIYATDNKRKGIVMLESRGKDDDKTLLKHINYIMTNKGQGKVSTKEFQEKLAEFILIQNGMADIHPHILD